MRISVSGVYPYLFAAMLAGCAIDPVVERLGEVPLKPLPPGLQVHDLRAEKWKTTLLVPNSRGAVQHFGDDAVQGGLPLYVTSMLVAQLQGSSFKQITFKTIDLRVSLPDLNVPTMGKFTLNADQVHYQLSAKSSISSVLCVTVDGADYLGDFGTLARFGLREELLQAIRSSVAKLAKNIESKQVSTSVACEPGWEGGQAR